MEMFFNDALNTFYLLLYGIKPIVIIVKVHSDSAATTWATLFN